LIRLQDAESNVEGVLTAVHPSPSAPPDLRMKTISELDSLAIAGKGAKHRPPLQSQ
jgi:hypothetical protein